MDHHYESHRLKMCEYNSQYPPMPILTKDEHHRNSRIELVEYMTPVRHSETSSNKAKYIELLSTVQTYKDLDPINHTSIPIIHHVYRIRLDYEVWEPVRDRRLRGYSVNTIARDFGIEVHPMIGEDNLVHNRFYLKIHDGFLLKMHELEGRGYIRLKLNKICVFYDITFGPVPYSSFIQPCAEYAEWVEPRCYNNYTYEDIEKNCIKVYERDYNDLIFGGIKDNDRINLEVTLVSNNIVLVNNLDEINAILSSPPSVLPIP